MSPRDQALDIIRNEHRTLAAVIDALRHVADEVAARALAPDYKLLWSLLYYIEEFPDRLHHPKEDQVLFPRIRLRSHEIDATLSDLERQHENGRPSLERIKTLLGRMEAEIPGAAEEFAAKVTTYSSFHAEHMRQEEGIVFPKAVQVLHEEDWVAIAQAFADNADPLSSGAARGNGGSARESEWFRQLFRKLVSLVPEPWGLGERRAA